MKTVKRYESAILENFRRTLINHIKLNLKDYLTLSIVFIIGVMVGVVIINNSDAESKTQISGYIKSFVDLIKGEGYCVDKAKLMKISIIQNLKIVLFIWIAGSTIIGIPLIYIITAYKGFCLGYTISAIILGLGVRKTESPFH